MGYKVTGTSSHLEATDAKAEEKKCNLNDPLKLPDLRMRTDEHGVRLPMRYYHLKPRGEGAFGKVYECIDNYASTEHKKVAVKQETRVFDDRTDCKRILRELAILAKCDSDHVVK